MWPRTAFFFFFFSWAYNKPGDRRAVSCGRDESATFLGLRAYRRTGFLFPLGRVAVGGNLVLWLSERRLSNLAVRPSGGCLLLRCFTSFVFEHPGRAERGIRPAVPHSPVFWRRFTWQQLKFAPSRYRWRAANRSRAKIRVPIEVRTLAYG